MDKVELLVMLFILPPKAFIDANATATGILNGFNPAATKASIRIDQGLDTTSIPDTYTIDADLNETQYIVEIDNRFGAITDIDGNPTNVSFY